MAVNQLHDGNDEGIQLGSATTQKVGFYGVSPVVQPSGAAQAAITDSSGGTANTSTGVAALTGSYNSTILANAIATILAQTAAIRTALVNTGIMKGGA